MRYGRNSNTTYVHLPAVPSAPGLYWLELKTLAFKLVLSIDQCVCVCARRHSQYSSCLKVSFRHMRCLPSDLSCSLSCLCISLLRRHLLSIPLVQGALKLFSAVPSCRMRPSSFRPGELAFDFPGLLTGAIACFCFFTPRIKTTLQGDVDQERSLDLVIKTDDTHVRKQFCSHITNYSSKAHFLNTDF